MSIFWLAVLSSSFPPMHMLTYRNKNPSSYRKWLHLLLISKVTYAHCLIERMELILQAGSPYLLQHVFGKVFLLIHS